MLLIFILQISRSISIFLRTWLPLAALKTRMLATRCVMRILTTLCRLPGE